MPRHPLPAVLLTIALAASAHAASTPPGVNLRWDNCFADGGVQNKAFACDTNVGLERLVASIELASPMLDVSGMEIIVDIGSASASLPAWWQVKNTGSCRQTALLFNTSLPSPASTCLDWSGGAAVGGIGSYVSPAHTLANAARFAATVVVPAIALAALSPGYEYHIASFTISHAKTVGAGACAGCETPVCIFLSRVRVTTPVTTNDVTDGANGLASQYATWQSGFPTDVHQLCDNPIPFEICSVRYTAFTCVPLATPTRASTWGAVKALYR